MKTVFILIVHCGWRAVPAINFKAILESAVDCRYDITELDLATPASPEQAGQLSECLHRKKPGALLLWLPAERPAEAAEAYFELAGERKWEIPVLAVSASNDPAAVVRLLQLGAADFLTLPLRPVELLARLRVLCPSDGEAEAVTERLRRKLGVEQVIGRTPAFVEQIRQLPAIARCDASVLLMGETGTGKDLLARAVHYLSPRANKPFVPVNCGAIPVELVENEFFGHESGAFTSATASRRGVIHEAHGGTLFLDEVDCLPPLAQVKLLQFLQDGQFRPLGSEKVCRADARIIAASNVDFDEAIASGRFRQDLYFRLNVLTLKLPPLRKRLEDIPLFARSFVRKYAGKFGAPARALSPAAVTKLLACDWPGNVRELENVIERAVVFADHALIQPEDLRTGPAACPAAEAGFQALKARAVAEFELAYLRQTLLAHGGNITRAAHAAKKDRRAFWELMRKHHLAGGCAVETGERGP